MKLGRTHPVCFAVGQDGVRVLRGEEEARFPWPAEDAPESVEQIIQEVRACLDDPGRARVSVLLLPPFVDVRRVTLPPLRPREITAVLENHGSRYFPRPMAEAATGWMPLESAGDDTAVLAAAAEQAPLAFLLEALSRLGHPVVNPVPAHAAWLLAAKRKTPFRADAESSVCIDIGQGALILGVRHGRLVSTTTFAREGLPGLIDRLRTGLRNGGAVVILGDGALADDVADDLRVGTPSEPVRIDEDPVRTAASFAEVCDGPVVLPREVRERHARRWRRAEVARFVTAGLLLLVAAGLDSWRLSRELRHLRGLRTDHAAEVEAALGMRERIGAVDDWLTDTREHVQADVRWGEWLARIVEALPASAEIDQVAGRAGELEISGSASSSADVLGAIQAVPGVIAVDLVRPVRRVQGATGLAEDQFSLVVRLTRESRP